MVKEVVDAINTAEKQAGSVIEQGRADAKAIITRAKAETAEKVRQIELDSQREYNDMIQKAENYAKKRAQVMINSANEKFREQSGQARQNIDKAVELILGRIGE